MLPLAKSLESCRARRGVHCLRDESCAPAVPDDYEEE